MAGGKETPRQKMIGMMYLFLTVMLALNVDSSILQKFLLIEGSLENAITEAVDINSGTIGRIEKAVDDLGNRDQDKAVLAKANEIRERTAALIKEMTDLKEQLVNESGGYVEGTKIPAKIAEKEKVSYYMLTEGKGDELKEKLNTYAAWLAESAPDEVPDSKIALDGNEHELFKDDPNNNRKSFAVLNFESTPIAAAMATISQFETEVLSRESLALDALARKVGASDLQFDNISLMVRPESKVVAAGSKYVADVFLTASASGIVPQVFRDGQPVPVEDGLGKVVIPAAAQNYDEEGLAKKTFTAAIKLNYPGIGDTTFTKEIEYLVAKPVISVQSQALSALYLNCGNELNVQVPALGSSYNPKISATGGAVIDGSQKGLVTVVPNNPSKVTLLVKNDASGKGQYSDIGTVEFRVKPIPKPEIELKNRNSNVNLTVGESISRLRNLSVVATADPDFAQNLPKDARYQVTKWRLTLARGSNAVRVINPTSPSVNLNQIISQARPNDRFVVEILEVQRLNFRGVKEVVRAGFKPITLPLKQ